MPKTLRKTLWFEGELAKKIEDLRSMERPIPSFSEMVIRLIWRGLSGYQTPRIDYERILEREAPRIKYCDSCGSDLGETRPRFCDSCGRAIIVSMR